MSEHVDYVFKYIIIGNGSVGKSSFLYRFINSRGRYSMNLVHENPVQTIGVEFASKNVFVCDKTIKLQLWDTAGQEKFRSIAKTYYRGAIGAFIVFDITNMESFESLSQWIKDAKEFSKQNILIVIIGNKVDLSDQRLVPTSEAQKFCSENGIHNYVETSAITGQNVEWAFQLISQKLLDRVSKGTIEMDLKPKFKSITVEKQPDQRECKC